METSKKSDSVKTNCKPQPLQDAQERCRLERNDIKRRIELELIKQMIFASKSRRYRFGLH